MSAGGICSFFVPSLRENGTNPRILVTGFRRRRDDGLFRIKRNNNKGSGGLFRNSYEYDPFTETNFHTIIPESFELFRDNHVNMKMSVSYIRTSF